MAFKLLKSIKPDSYLHDIYDIKYQKLRENGIKYAVFDLDCTILPFDDIKVGEDEKILFKYINNLGIETALCSSGSVKRVKPVADILDVEYMARAKKPNVEFSEISKMFSGNPSPHNTVHIGDSLYLDMVLASKNGMNKILVDMIRDGFKFKLVANDFIQAIMYQVLKHEDFHYGKYYHGQIER